MSDYWAGQKAAQTPAAVLELASELFEHARILKARPANSAEREADLTSHISVAGMLRSAQNRAPYSPGGGSRTDPEVVPVWRSE
jgi:hypothetical protein